MRFFIKVKLVFYELQVNFKKLCHQEQVQPSSKQLRD